MDINGTSGDDVIDGTSAADTVNAGSGNDTVYGYDGNDKLNGGAGDDNLYGGAGNDTITGDTGFDRMCGGDGNDVLVTKRGTGPDFFDGGAGIDRVSVDFVKSNRAIAFDLTNTTVLQYLGDGSSMINVEQISATGSTFGDTMIGGSEIDTLVGYTGDDILKGNGGNDKLTGDDGYDTAVFNGPRSAYTVTLLADGSYSVSGGTDGTDNLTSIENLRFSDGDYAIGGDVPSAVYWGSSDGFATLVAADPLPDGLGMTPGTGFTITGLARAADGTWWAANEGQSEPDDQTYTPSLIHLSADFSTKLGEISFGTNIRSLQGLTIKQSTGEIFVASLSQGLVMVYGANGTFLRSFAPQTGTSVNGLAYDPTLDAIIIGHENGNTLVKQIEWRSLSTNTQLKTITVSKEPDHLFYDASYGTQGALYYTTGDSGAGRTGYVIKVDVATGHEIATYTLNDADAIEGIWIEGEQMWLANDAYFHRGDPALSRVLDYVRTPEAKVVDLRDYNGSTTIDLNVYDQTLSNGTRLVGIERLFFHGGSGSNIATGGAFDDVLVGGNANDTLRGGGGDDRLVGIDGDDMLTGAEGNDMIDGGAGTDKVIFSGSRATYSVVQLSATSVRVTDMRAGSPDGVDVIRSVESFQFSDGTFSFSQVLVAPNLQLNLTSGVVAENAAAGTVVGTLSVAGGGGSGTYTYTILGDAHGFTISDNQLMLASGPLNHEDLASFNLSIRAVESGGGTVTSPFAITVTDQNDPVTDILFSPDNHIVENDVGGTRVATLIIADEDIEDAFLDNVVTVDDPRIAVIDNGIYLKPGVAIDYETESQITLHVTVTSSNGATLTRTLTVQVDNVDEAPTLALNPVLTHLAENSAIGTGEVVAHATLGTALSGTDTLTLTGANAASFSLVAVSGGYDLVYTGTSPDFEAKSHYDVAVVLDQSGGTHVEQAFTLSVDDVDEAPSLALTPVLTHLAEDSTIGAGVVVAHAGVTDDALGANTVTLSGADASSFSLVAVSGGYDLVYTGASPNFETKAQYDVTVVLEDAAIGTHVEQAFTLAIDDINENLTLSLTPVQTSVAENSPIGAGIVVAHATSSADPSGTHTVTLSGADAASFTLVAASGGYDLIYTGTSPNFEAKSHYDVTVVLDDGQGTHVDEAFTLSVDDVDEAPSLALTPVLTHLAENTAIGAGIVVAHAVVTDDTLGTNTVTLGGADAASFSLVAVSGGYDLVYTGASPNFESKSQYDVSVVLDDPAIGSGAEATAAYSLAIDNANEAPSLALNPVLTHLAENSSIGSGIVVAHAVLADDALGTNNVTLSGANAASFSLVAASGGYDLVYTGSSPNFESNSQYNVNVVVDDPAIGSGAEATAAYSLAIDNVNEAPSLALNPVLTHFAENSTVGSGVVVAQALITDDSLGTNSVTLTGADAASFSLVAISGGYNLVYTGASPDYETKSLYNVSVVLDDAAIGTGAEGTAPFTLSIDDVYEAGVPTEGNDRGPTAIYGTSANDVLYGLGGDDELYGFGGDDTLYGGTGNDTMIGGAGADALYGGGGIDTASYATATAGFTIDMGSPSKNTGDAKGDVLYDIVNIIASGYDDKIIGNNSGNEVWGGAGADAISGGGGADLIHGGTGNDTLYGQAGNDYLWGDAGNDTLSGGLGSFDYFFFNTSSFGNDTITDWEDNLDKIIFTGSGLTFAQLSFVQNGSNVEIHVPDSASSILVLNATVGNFTVSDFVF